MARIAPRRPIILPAQTNLQPTSPSPSLLVTDRQAPHVNTSSTSRRCRCFRPATYYGEYPK
jgi:hypothetical protein